MRTFRFILLLYGIILITGQAFAAEVTVNPSTRIVSQLETFDLNITINPGGTRIAGAQLNIEFNPLLFRVNSITEGNLFNQNGANTFFNSGTIDNSTGTVINVFNAIIGNSNISTQGTFIIINVTAIGITGTSGINLSNVKISDPNALAVSFNAANGSFTILAIPAGYGYIYGKVINDSVGIAGVVVSTNTSNTTKTDALGTYSLLVPASTYKLTATREPKFYLNSSITVTVLAGTSVMQNIELMKKQTGKIRGSVDRPVGVDL